jgi:hypothetical protein
MLEVRIFHPMDNLDLNDGKPWSEMDDEDLRASVAAGATLPEAAMFLCRSGAPLEVAKRAKELSLKWQQGGVRRKPK